jgi:hypothetical protein
VGVVLLVQNSIVNKRLKINAKHAHRIHGAGIYTNIGGILMESMIPYIAAPWILWDMQLLRYVTRIPQNKFTQNTNPGCKENQRNPSKHKFANTNANPG